jgi:hypothetical protein
MIEGFLESLTEAGIFTGWLRDTSDAAPAIVEVRALSPGGAARPVAHAVASAFRPDLLRGGHGHGHYGFRARLMTALPPGPRAFELYLPRQAQGVRTRLAIPQITLQDAVRVESLLRPDPTWTVADLLAALACLDLAALLARLGSTRFIDAAYRFVLNRWPERGEATAYALALADGGAAAEDVVRELLTSRERTDLGPELMSPWDHGYPFASPGRP